MGSVAHVLSSSGGHRPPQPEPRPRERNLDISDQLVRPGIEGEQRPKIALNKGAQYFPSSP